MEQVHILLYYKFQPIKDVEYFIRVHKRKCEELAIVGKVLVGNEGVNGSVAGTYEQMEEYKEFFQGIEGFEDLWFKEELGNEAPFNKMIVREKKEIVSLQKKVDMSRKGKYVNSEEFLEGVKDEDTIIIDTRNDYEYEVGKFKGAVNPNIKTFREFPEFVDKFKEKVDKDKKIFMYCTGGIRCEKASLYMEDQGFTDVHQLHGGIINFRQEIPDKGWEGKCFVFDKRLVTKDSDDAEVISECISCGETSDLQRNCKNVGCDDLVVQCAKCQEKLHGCCREECMYEFLEYTRERAQKKKDGTWIAPELSNQNYLN
jgi:UPF0176 protein